MIAAYSSDYTARSSSVRTVVDSRLLVFVKRDHSLAVCCPANRRRGCRQTPLHSQRHAIASTFACLPTNSRKKPEISATNEAIAGTHQYRVENSSFLERSSVHQSASLTTARRHIRHLYTLWTPTSHRARRFHCEKRRTPSGSLVAPAQGGEPSLPEVLLVDDDRAFVETLAMLLRLEGYTVTAAFSVDAAVRYLGASTPDVLISDIEIGRSNGGELVRYANRYNPDLHVVVVTGDADLFAAKWEYFYTPVFLKPFDPNQLLDYLRRHVR
jgi:CheY-like chemotaxis protein